MNAENQVLAIDAGNTSVKVGLFQNGELTEIRRFTLNDLDELEKWSIELKCEKVIVSTVLTSEDTAKITSRFNKPLVISNETPLFFKLIYNSKALGIDRICNAAFMASKSEREYTVTIDIGTCIKFDLFHANEGYLGGSIAPGIALRYKSLNDYTGNLPLLSNKTRTKLVGNDTFSCIHSGVINGIHAEIQGITDQYVKGFEDLTFFVTGGDASFFDIHSKNDIFADENLTLKGLFEIYKYNA